MMSSEKLHFYSLPPCPCVIVRHCDSTPPLNKKLCHHGLIPPPPELHFFQICHMLYKIDMHLLSFLIADGNKPAQKIACVYMRTEELLTTEKLNSDLTAVGLLVMCTQEETRIEQ